MSTWGRDEGRQAGGKEGSLAAWPLTLLPAGAGYVNAPSRAVEEGSLAQRTPGGADAGCLLSLQVRLLTGIGRYSEMTYALDLLHERHCFEMLMRKKLDPVGAQFRSCCSPDPGEAQAFSGVIPPRVDFGIWKMRTKDLPQTYSETSSLRFQSSSQVTDVLIDAE